MMHAQERGISERLQIAKVKVLKIRYKISIDLADLHFFYICWGSAKPCPRPLTFCTDTGAVHGSKMYWRQARKMSQHSKIWATFILFTVAATFIWFIGTCSAWAEVEAAGCNFSTAVAAVIFCFFYFLVSPTTVPRKFQKCRLLPFLSKFSEIVTMASLLMSSNVGHSLTCCLVRKFGQLRQMPPNVEAVRVRLLAERDGAVDPEVLRKKNIHNGAHLQRS
jgi:hypothetical protein